MATRKLTPELLRQIVNEERIRILDEAKKKKKKIKESDGISADAKEVGPEDLAGTLAKQTDFIKAQGIKNESIKLEKLARLAERLTRLQEAVAKSATVSRAKIVRKTK